MKCVTNFVECDTCLGLHEAVCSASGHEHCHVDAPHHPRGAGPPAALGLGPTQSDGQDASVHEKGKNAMASVQKVWDYLLNKDLSLRIEPFNNPTQHH
jgi:hypothetical protein